uniref:Reverse transcriptase n=1 Tax=Strongyloides venezuelensis TaxID=75913 RepID=A0A0K0FAV4_STRVS
MDIKNTKIVVACQEEQVSLRAHPAFDYANKNCRVCDAELETVRHVINECLQYKNTLYKARHNWVASTIMKHLCKRFKIQFARNGENDICKFVYDSPWTVSVNLKHHILDIVLQDKENKVIYVIEVSCPWFGFMQEQLNIKRVKYTVHSKSEVGLDWRSYKKDVNFCDALSLQEKMKVVFLPVIISSTGQVFKETQDLFERYFGPSKGLFILLSRYSVLGTTRIIKWHFTCFSN